MDLATQKHFEDTVSVNKDGRFVVHLPWISDHPALPSNYGIALKRLHSTVRRLKNEGYYEAYQRIFDEWQQDEIIEEVPSKEADFPSHYLPHRHVVKLSSSTTPVRPVFDGSAHEVGAPSLNQCLQKGPNLIEKIPTVLAQFRKKKIGVVGDIKRAFLQIVICRNDRNSLRFLWLDESGNVKIYRHCRVVFGVSPSPFLLEAAIKLHLDKTLASCRKGEKHWPLALVEQLSHSFYVDNCMTSCDDESIAQSFIDAASEILMERQFELRGWELTSPGIPTLSSTNVLGLAWNRNEDTLSINLESLTSMVIEKVTKKTMLSSAHRLFDPVGVTSPVALIPKLLIQQTWKLHLTWEEEVPEDIGLQFRAWVKDIIHLSDLKIPRWISTTGARNENCSLRVFSDACQTSYAAVVFLRVELDDQVNVQLLAAKARVAPIGVSAKKMTIPRLELLGASIAARLCQSVAQDFGFDNVKTTFYTDASTVLAWIIRHEIWDTFVNNRVQEIRDLTEGCEWQHIPGVENPADMPSRGASAKKLVQSQWWEGPTWLRLPPEHWPRSDVEFNENEIQLEKKKSVVSSMLCATTTDQGWFYRYFSQYTKIIRLLGWIFRFKNNTLKKEYRNHQDLTKEEFEAAENIALRLVQEEVFEGISDSKLASLLPFKDEEGVIRLRTKVSHRNDIHDFCYPAVLPSTAHPFVYRLVMHIHSDNCHAGTQLVLSTLRQRFWILGGRRSVRKVVNDCKRCKRHSAKRVETEPSPLPENRVRNAKVFEIVGVDLAGPLYLRNDDGSSKKHWICLFTCGVYRAVHLELISSQSTDSFLLALRRFTNRRGRPQIIYSDQGTNFVGADNAFKSLDWNIICQYSTVRRIEWRFNPPSAPWWGGFWERLIGVLKNLLKKVLGRSSVCYEEMLTILCDCEGVINSRPLTYLSQDATDLAPLTPSMFLNDVDEVGTADMDLIESTDLRKRHEYRQKLKQALCQRFRNEYLGQLKLFANRSKRQNLSVGDMVLVGSDNSKRLDWPLGRVTDLIAGTDGHVRVARIRTAHGALVRPLQRLFPLELDVKICDEGVGAQLRNSFLHSSPEVEPMDLDEEPCSALETAYPEPSSKSPAVSRSGRLVKKPEKLDL
ncbi:unnamed protein product [Nesidiocoris tenuis]|uniref:Integrase catalytic domain-containing protein n=1 Tax=Nesidiocoris tenuis TaxID=355587 RepID=A0A6H5GV31_9HEMI|nr:unnamed protein product [Nesidiocoris tenuis]